MADTGGEQADNDLKDLSRPIQAHPAGQAKAILRHEHRHARRWRSQNLRFRIRQGKGRGVST
eukprot:4708031-Pleurochrysis_carterae.AAC.1